MTRDLMFRQEIQGLVRDVYESLEEPDAPAAGLYDAGQLDGLPDGARRWALGVGNPVAHAALSPGEVVLDVGCGSGIDTLLAAGAVGPTGRAIGVDLLPAMVERGRRFAAEGGVTNAEFLQGSMEELPLPDDSVDVVVSNGAINLSARKSRVLAEIFRVLRPGGRMTVSDLTIREEDLPIEVLTHPSAWAG